MQAIILAAGMGKRLKELTNDVTKCMVKINDVTMIERMLSQLDNLNLNKIIIVIGYKGNKLKDFIKTLNVNTPIDFVENKIYDKTNNIYSLFLAKDYLLNEDSLILESDLIFENGILEDLVNDSYPNLALVAKFESWMDGTVVTIDNQNNIMNFLSKNQFSFENIPNYYKTVNIYKFSKDFSNHYYVPFLEAYIQALGTNEYYEQVLKVISNLDESHIKVKKLVNKNWYEIDDIQDLNIAESIFASDDEKLSNFNSRYGGYWRYTHMLDFCYLVNPYFPPQSLIDELKSNFEILLESYPSGIEINSLLAAKYFGVHQNQICVGNGASELIKSLIEKVSNPNDNLGIVIPTFEEYSHRKNPDNIIAFTPTNNNFKYGVNDLISFFSDKNIGMLILINPDNPSGNYICKNDVLRLAKWADNNDITLIVDESFVDFEDIEENPSFLNQEILTNYPNLIIVKSISKSFGVPGLRLGILASNNLKLVDYIKKDVAIWNINSFGEFYLQICEKYKSDYENGIVKFKRSRDKLEKELNSIKNLRVIPSQANYFMCEVFGEINSSKLSEILLNEYDILIKDLSSKIGCDGKSYIRLAVHDEKDNSVLINALKEILG